MDEKTIAMIMQEEREKLLAEVKEKVKQKKLLIKNEPETGFQSIMRSQKSHPYGK